MVITPEPDLGPPSPLGNPRSGPATPPDPEHSMVRADPEYYGYEEG